MIRVATASFCAIAGTVAAGLAVSALSVVGFDDEAQAETFRVSDGAYAVVLNEATVPFADTTATLTVNGEDPLFLGTANGVDAESYLTGVAHEEITEVSFPGEPVHRMVAGEAEPVVPAESRDWWTSTEEGTSVSRTFDLEADPEIIIVAPQEGGSLAGAEVTVSMRADSIAGLAVLGLAVAVMLFGIAGFFVMQWWQSRIRIRPKRPGARRGRPKRAAAAASGPAGRSASEKSAVGQDGVEYPPGSRAAVEKPAAEVGSGEPAPASGGAGAAVAEAGSGSASAVPESADSGAGREAAPAAEAPVEEPRDRTPSAEVEVAEPADRAQTADSPEPTAAEPASAEPATTAELTAAEPSPVDDEPEYDGPPRTRRERREREARARARKERGL